MKLIATVDKNWGIGKCGKRLVQIPSELRILNNETMGKVVVMGRKTYEIYEGLLSAQNREILVITKNPASIRKYIKTVDSIENLLEMIKDIPQEDIYIVGGESIFKQLLPYCTSADITKIDFAYAADSFLENLEQSEEWYLTDESEEQTYFNLEYTFQKYKRK